jgi:hypothetical protein
LLQVLIFTDTGLEIEEEKRGSDCERRFKLRCVGILSELGKGGGRSDGGATRSLE